MINGVQGGRVWRDGDLLKVSFPLDLPEEEPIELDLNMVGELAMFSGERPIGGNVTVSCWNRVFKVDHREKLPAVEVSVESLLKELL